MSGLEMPDDVAPIDREKQTLYLKLRSLGPLPTPDAPQVNELDTPLFGAAASPKLI